MAYAQGRGNGSKINASKNDNDERKIFVGGLSWESSVDDLKTYFQRFGDVLDANIKIDLNTGLSRGFGFVLFKDASSVQKVCADKNHILGGKNIDPKPAVAGGVGPSSYGKDPPCKKIFVGGLDTNLSQEEIAEHFSQYGKVELVELPYDKVKNQRRAFGFITFDNEDIVEQMCQNAKVPFGDKMLDVRKAVSREQQEAHGYRGGRGGGPMRGAFRGKAGGYYNSMGGYEMNGLYGGPPYGGYDYYGYYGGGGHYGAASHPYDHSAIGSYGDGAYGPSSYQSTQAAAGTKVARRGTWQSDTNATTYHPYNR
ncbi:hypothetical protein HELRODRAFT_94668 [Helobdella robusta]|uniref:RRM domain-containing protein n=1 Tax=Helobdella robusta TaxID=6412 RepID=T1G921_HELRO|nr:hypothetical protein HELRODRAFT_94668 [Helobdella robusta]ESO02590.1 hypothetical protein HELRODRAFT_94668 [Helobdella robusta]